MSATAEDILSKYEQSVATQGLLLRDYLLKSLPAIIEYPDEPANIIGYGYGPGYKDSICTIIPSKKGIKLGFYKATELPDPHHLLTGSGKVHKYVDINSEQNIHQPALKQLLQEALKAYHARNKKSD